MRRSILLVLPVALAVLVFAPVAAAQSDDRGADDRGMDDRGMDDDATASPASSVSASATASATSSASASASPTSSATSSPAASPSSQLPDTGGISFTPMLSASVLALFTGYGIIATILVRRAS